MLWATVNELEGISRGSALLWTPDPLLEEDLFRTEHQNKTGPRLAVLICKTIRGLSRNT